MHRARQLVGEHGIHHALALHAISVGECAGDDFYPEMGFALGTGTDMTGMLRRFVDDVERHRLEGLGELGFDILRDRHDTDDFLRTPASLATLDDRQ